MRAYPVPFRVDRSMASVLRLRNASGEALHWVRAEMLPRGLAAAPLTSRLEPGEWLVIRVRGTDLARDARLIVRWRRPSGEEYLYGIAL